MREIETFQFLPGMIVLNLPVGETFHPTTLFVFNVGIRKIYWLRSQSHKGIVFDLIWSILPPHA